MRFGLDRLGQPGMHFGHALFGDHVALELGAGSELRFAGFDLAVPGESRQRRVDLPERQWLAPAEEFVVVALEVVAVARFAFEQAEEGQWHRHTQCLLSVCTWSQ